MDYNGCEYLPDKKKKRKSIPVVRKKTDKTVWNPPPLLREPLF